MKYNLPIRYGIFSAIIMIALLMIMYIINMNWLASQMWMMILYVPLIFLMIYGGIGVRKENNEELSFGKALVVVLIISVIATTLFDGFGYVLYKYIDPKLPVFIKEKSIENATEMMERFGTPEDDIEQQIEKVKMQDFTPTIQTLAYRMAFSYFIGLIFSLIIAAFIKRNPTRLIAPPDADIDSRSATE